MTSEKKDTTESRGRLRSWLIFLLKLSALVALFFIQISFPNINERFQLPIRLPQAVFLFLTVHLVVDFLRMSLAGFYLRKRGLPRTTRDNFTIGIQQISIIADVITLVFSMLVMFDIDIAYALTAISIFAAAIAILSKDYVSNMINGLLVMFANQISINDYVKIGDQKGNVIDINLLNLHLLNDDDDLIFIPNNIVFNASVTNFSKRAINRVSIVFEVSYNYLKSIESLEEYLITNLKEYQKYIVPGSYNLRAGEIKKDAALLKFQFILSGGSNPHLERKIRRQTIRKIVEYINRDSGKQT